MTIPLEKIVHYWNSPFVQFQRFAIQCKTKSILLIFDVIFRFQFATIKSISIDDPHFITSKNIIKFILLFQIIIFLQRSRSLILNQMKQTLFHLPNLFLFQIFISLFLIFFCYYFFCLILFYYYYSLNNLKTIALEDQLKEAKDLEGGIWKEAYQLLLTKGLSHSFPLVSSSCFRIIVKLTQIYPLGNNSTPPLLSFRNAIQNVSNALPSLNREVLLSAISCLIELISSSINVPQQPQNPQTQQNTKQSKNNNKQSQSQTQPIQQQQTPLSFASQILVAVCKSRIDCIHELLSELLSSKSLSIESKLELLKNILIFVLSDSTTNPTWKLSSISRVCRSLLSINNHSKNINESLTSPVIQLLIDLIPIQSLHSIQESAIVQELCEQICFVLDSVHIPRLENSQVVASDFVDKLLAISVHFRFSGRSVQPFLEYAFKIVLKFSVSMSATPERTFTMAWLLAGSQLDSDVSVLLGLMQNSVSKKQKSSLFLSNWIFPFLEIHSSPNSSNQSTILLFLRKVEELIDITFLGTTPQSEIPKSTSKATFGFYSLFRSLSSSLEKLLLKNPTTDDFSPKKFIEQMQISFSGFFEKINNNEDEESDQTDSTIKEPHLSKQQQQQYQITDSSNSHFLLVLVSSFLFHQDPNVRSAVCAFISTMASQFPFQTLRLLPVLLYKINSETNEKVRTDLFYTLPSLATDFDCVPIILQSLQPLLESQVTQPLAVRLIEKLWELQSRLFPTLLPLLQSYNFETQSIEMRLAISTSIRDVCKKNSEKGSDLIGELSQIVSKETNPTILSLAIDSLITLATEDVLDFETAYAVLSRAFSEGQESFDPLVLTTWLNFLGSGSKDASEETGLFKKKKKRKKKLFQLHSFCFVITELYHTIVDFAWECTSNKSPKVRGAAFKCLSQYAEKSLVYLGYTSASNTTTTNTNETQQKQEGEGEEDENSEEKQREILFSHKENSIGQLDTWLRVLQETHEDALPQSREFVLTVLNTQTATRGIQLQTESHGKANEILSIFATSLRKIYDGSNSAAARGAIAGSLLFSTTHERSSNPKTKGKTQEKE